MPEVTTTTTTTIKIFLSPPKFLSWSFVVDHFLAFLLCVSVSPGKLDDSWESALLFEVWFFFNCLISTAGVLIWLRVGNRYFVCDKGLVLVDLSYILPNGALWRCCLWPSRHLWLYVWLCLGFCVPFPTSSFLAGSSSGQGWNILCALLSWWAPFSGGLVNTIPSIWRDPERTFLVSLHSSLKQFEAVHHLGGGPLFFFHLCTWGSAGEWLSCL